MLKALEEVENALVSLQSARAQVAELSVATEAASNAAILARSQYRTGLTDFRTLLEAERSLLATRDSAASAKAEEANATIRLYLALGGGWQPDEILQ